MSIIPSTTWRMVAERPRGEELPSGLDAAYDRLAGWVNGLVPRRRECLRRAALVVRLEGEFAGLTEARLREQARDLREKFALGRETADDVHRGFALVREVAFRELGERPYAVQVAGALAIESGCVVEMATGEGKTLTATMPATVAGWRGRGCHVVTVNDYLARRDAEWMTRVYRTCGVSVAYIEEGMAPPERRRAYGADVTYCTNKEVAADFLRDRLALGRTQSLSVALLGKIAGGRGGGTDRLVQRGLETAIVDEADSVLIDEAVTPLLIAGDAPNPEQVEAFREASNLAREMESGRDYRVNERYREVDLTERGKGQLADLTRDLGGVWAGVRRREELVVQALTARHFYTRDKQYIVEEGKVVIVDEFTGRLMRDRTWRDGFHQAVEAMETLEVNPPKATYARVSFQRFFRMYRKLSGMTGTAEQARREFWQIYHLPVVVIPTNRPCVREMKPDRVFGDEESKWNAVAEEIKRLNQTGRPVLVGTRSVAASERVSAGLTQLGLEHAVLNAVRHKEEAHVVAEAGQPGRITVATNMAGRGTDIRLGRGVAAIGGLHVLATERHESGRIDRQLFGRCARQGDPGSTQAFVSLEDELVRRQTPHLSQLMRRIHTKGEISGKITRIFFDYAQHCGERQALSQRKQVLRTDDWLDEYLGFAGSEL